MKGIMIQGCTSDAGKSYIVTALCRIFANKGYNVVPFKSQNMANNSYVTYDGKEIGRAQGVQALAAKQEPAIFMNPILLKPRQSGGSEIVLNGEVFGSMSGMDYRKDFALSKGMDEIKKSLRYIEENFDMVVIEGAGSPCEMNLNDCEIVNMSIAKEADVPVLLVVDINRGGSFASIVGTLELLGEDRKRVRGLIFNKFKGELSYFMDGKQWIEDYTGIPVVGIMPYTEDVVIEGEDSLSINFQKNGVSDFVVNIGVARLPFISNHTDMEAFAYESDVSIRFIDKDTNFNLLDAVIIPGTKSTISDLEYLRSTGIADKIIDFAKNGGIVYGVCGGYQIMGETLTDPYGVDMAKGTVVDGLGLLPVATSFETNKAVGQVSAKGIHSLIAEMKLEGYEIHLGQTESTNEDFIPLFDLGHRNDGFGNDELSLAGSYLHNIFHNDQFRNLWLNGIRAKKGYPARQIIDTKEIQDKNFDKLAEYAINNMDIEQIMKIIED